MQAELTATRNQVGQMAQSYDQLRAAHEALRLASDNALNQRAAEIAAMEQKLQQLLFNQKFDLLDMKTLQPEVFKGKHTEAFKPWAKKVKAFCNAKKAGFRKALDGQRHSSRRFATSVPWPGRRPRLRTRNFTTFSCSCAPRRRRSSSTSRACREEDLRHGGS